jgi:gliding motility-associated-like protein
VTTDANGNAFIALTSKVAGNVNITATVGGTQVQFGSPATVEFVAGPPSLTDDSTQLKVIVNFASANGSATNSVEAHVADSNGNAVSGQQIVFAILSGAGTIVGSETVTTDSNGNAIIQITSNTADTVKVVATLNSYPITNGSPATVIFINNPNVVSDSTYLAVVVYEAIADGQSTTSVVAHVVDQNGTALSGQSVTFSIDSGTATIVTAQPVITDSNGNAVIQISSSKAGFVLITATVGGNSIVNGSPARVLFAPVNIYVPRVFTPNGDGTNDILKPILVGITSFHYFSVYNRWGNLLFTTENAANGWDGTFKGVPQPVETYLWIAEGVNNQGKTIVQKGMVSLVR